MNKTNKNKGINIKINKRIVTAELFGKFPRWKSKKSSQELKDEMRK